MALSTASFCSGIGAPEYASSKLGWESVFVSEVAPAPNAVLKYRFPDIPNLGDMNSIDGVKYRGSIDVIVAGTPCQGFSAIGKQKGLEDDRSRLAVRFVELLAQIRPLWFIWENVPGVFSTNKGQDFADFLGALTGTKPNKPSRGWKNSGIAYGIPSAYSIAWRTLDAQYYGVAQRRKRVFIVGHLGRDWRPPVSVLFEPQSFEWNGKPSRSSREQSTASNSGVFTELYGFTTKNKFGDLVDNLSPTLTTKNRPGVIGVTLNRKSTGLSNNVSPTLKTDSESSVILGFSANMKFSNVSDDLSPTLDTSCSRNCVYKSYPFPSIRKLTPIECERLQGFPDGWTDVPYGERMMFTSLRYSTLGNSIAVPVIYKIQKDLETVHNLLYL